MLSGLDIQLGRLTTGHSSPYLVLQRNLKPLSFRVKSLTRKHSHDWLCYQLHKYSLCEDGNTRLRPGLREHLLFTPRKYATNTVTKVSRNQYTFRGCLSRKTHICVTLSQAYIPTYRHYPPNKRYTLLDYAVQFPSEISRAQNGHSSGQPTRTERWIC
jgi:hypothetical protein